MEYNGGHVRIRWQSGTIKDEGVNGASVEEVLRICISRLEYLNDELPCVENLGALNEMRSALNWLDARTNDRIKRKVEGTMMV